MKSTIENLTPTRIKVQVEVPFSELKPSLDAAYQKIASQISVPGFRKGKVPTQVIDQRVGRPAVLQEAVNEAVPKAYAEALKDKKVYPIGRPNVKVDELKENEELKFSAEVDVRPDFETPKYKGLKLQVEKARELGEDVLKQLEDLRARFSTLSAVERAVKDQDVVILDITGTKDGVQVNEYSGQALAYTVGSNGLVPGADEVLIGAKAEQKVKLDFTPEDGPFKDQQISLDITVNSVNEKVLPDATSKKLEDKFNKGEDFTFEDFLSQLEAMKNMGSMSKLMGLLPGAGGMKKQIENFDESELVRARAIIESMTPLERRDPKVLNGSRRARIALGSGRAVSEINSLVERFSQAQKMMKQIRGGNMPAGMSAPLAGMSGAIKPKPGIQNVKKKSRSGNPAKRAIQEGM